MCEEQQICRDQLKESLDYTTKDFPFYSLRREKTQTFFIKEWQDGYSVSERVRANKDNNPLRLFIYSRGGVTGTWTRGLAAMETKDYEGGRDGTRQSLGGGFLFTRLLSSLRSCLGHVVQPPTKESNPGSSILRSHYPISPGKFNGFLICKMGLLRTPTPNTGGCDNYLAWYLKTIWKRARQSVCCMSATITTTTWKSDLFTISILKPSPVHAYWTHPGLDTG